MAGAIEKYKWLPKPGAPWLLGWGGGRHGVRRKANGDQLSPLGGIGYWFSPELLEPNTEAFLMD